MSAVLEPMGWNRAKIEQVQEERLLEVVELAFARSTLTQAIWKKAQVTAGEIRSRQDFVERVPFLTSNDIRDPALVAADPFRGLLCRPIHELTGIGSTSGTTGLPQPLPQHEGDVRSQSGARDLWMNGVRAGDVVLVSGAATRSGHTVERFHEIGAIPVFEDWDPSIAGRLVETIRQYLPMHWSLINGPFVVALQRYASETEQDLLEAFSSVKSVIWGGEPLASRTRRLIEVEWGMSVRQMTSLGNASPAIECEAQAGSHTWEDLVFVECIDPESGQAVPDGERGELVITTVADRAAPMIRYRSDDLVEFTKEPCSCGLQYGRLRTIGRLGDRVPVGDKALLPSDVWHIISEYPATAEAQFQLVRSKTTDQALAVRVGYNPSVAGGDPASVATELAAQIEAAIGVRCKIEPQPLEDLMRRRTGVKLPRVVED
jgi:phenylacetate-CoA ligase